MKTIKAVNYYGGRRQLAEALGITRQAVEQWGEYVAEGMAYKLQVLTAGLLMVDASKYKRK
jgi:DNA-binding transcriptional regulator YdaS (Cro superfamily)